MFRQIIVILLFLLIKMPIQAQEDSKLKKHQLSICAFLKEETHLLEWIEYHQLVGVDHFYLYHSENVNSFDQLLSVYREKEIITLIPWPDRLSSQNKEDPSLWMLSTQIPAYENAAKVRGLTETKWLVFLDTNEFLVCPHLPKLVDLLQRYDKYPGVTLTCSFFNSYNRDGFSKKKLLIENIKMIKKPEQDSLRSVEKVIFKPDCCKGFTWPPLKYTFKDHQDAVTLKKDKLRINCYANKESLDLWKTNREFDSRMLSEEEIHQLLEEDYEILDQEQPIVRFAPQLKIYLRQK